MHDLLLTLSNILTVAGWLFAIALICCGFGLCCRVLVEMIRALSRPKWRR